MLKNIVKHRQHKLQVTDREIYVVNNNNLTVMLQLVKGLFQDFWNPFLSFASL